MRETPSIVPVAPDQDYHIVICGFRSGPSFLETSLDHADRETVVRNMIAGEYSDPLRVIMLNPESRRCEDVSRAIADEVLRRIASEGSQMPPSVESFIELAFRAAA